MRGMKKLRSFVKRVRRKTAIPRSSPPLENPFWYYAHIVDTINEIPDTYIHPLYALRFEDATGKKLIGLRHDVDSKPRTALRQARHLARKGVCGSFYLLHTAPYYGEYHGGTFIRNPHLGDLVRAFIVAGCEIGLHNDALAVKCENGVERVEQELNWLREAGAVVEGTTAHNTFLEYGAANSEIFKERMLNPTPPKRLPIGELYEERLGLTYEGTYAVPKPRIEKREMKDFQRITPSVRSEKWMKLFLTENPYCNWDLDYQFWLTGRDKWVAAGEDLYEWEIDSTALFKVIRNLPRGTHSIMVIHPDYFEEVA